MLALLVLALALGLSNFAAAMGIGVSGVRGGTRMRVAVVFGLFEAGMPVLGLALGHGLAEGLGEVARSVGGAVLIAVGVISLILARRSPDREHAQEGRPWRTGRIVASGFALSADNLAAGFALGAYHTGLAAAAVVFGGVSAIMSLAGLELGATLGARAGERSELAASALLVAVGAAVAAGVL